MERFGKFQSVLEPGLHFMVPLIDRVAYVHSLKEVSLSAGSSARFYVPLPWGRICSLSCVCNGGWIDLLYMRFCIVDWIEVECMRAKFWYRGTEPSFASRRRGLEPVMESSRCANGR